MVRNCDDNGEDYKHITRVHLDEQPSNKWYLSDVHIWCAYV